MGDRLSRRQVLASLAMSREMPMPTQIHWIGSGSLWLHFDGIAAVRAWAVFFNAPTSAEPAVRGDQRVLIHFVAGWGHEQIALYGSEPVEEPVEELGDGVRELLEDIMEVAGDDTD